MAIQTPNVNTDVYKGSFFPQAIRDWNALPESLISSAEDAEDCVAKLTSLVRATYVYRDVCHVKKGGKIGMVNHVLDRKGGHNEMKNCWLDKLEDSQNV